MTKKTTPTTRFAILHKPTATVCTKAYPSQGMAHTVEFYDTKAAAQKIIGQRAHDVGEYEVIMLAM